MKRVKLTFGKFEFFPELIIGKINEGVHFDMEKNKELTELATAYYGLETPLSYISIRENDYSVDPMIHKHNTFYENLCAIAVVEQKPKNQSTVQIESKFFKPGKMLAFTNIEEALSWANHEVSLKMTPFNNNISLN